MGSWLSQLCSPSLLLCIERSLMTSDLFIPSLTRCLEQLARPALFSINAVVISDFTIKWTDKPVPCTLRFIQLLIDWLKDQNAIFSDTIRTTELCSLLRENMVEIILLKSTRPFVENVQWDLIEQELCSLKTVKKFHVRIIDFEPKFLEHNIQETGKQFESARNLADLSFGTFGFVWITNHGDSCGGDCLVLKIFDSRSLYLHVMICPQHVQLITSNFGCTYFRLPCAKRGVAPNITVPFDLVSRKVALNYWNRLHTRGKIRLSESQLAIGTDVYRLTTDREISSVPGKLSKGTQVLARRLKDGHFYLGRVQTVRSPDSLNFHVLVRFGPIRKFLKARTPHCFSVYEYELIPITDIINVQHARMYVIGVGDKVLVRDPQSDSKCLMRAHSECQSRASIRYLPGSVLSITYENSTGRKQADSQRLDEKQIYVKLENNGIRSGCYLIKEFTAIKIPNELFQRIVLEQLMPQSARVKLKNSMKPFRFSVV